MADDDGYRSKRLLPSCTRPRCTRPRCTHLIRPILLSILLSIHYPLKNIPYKTFHYDELRLC
jgi:hypothetical protein